MKSTSAADDICRISDFLIDEFKFFRTLILYQINFILILFWYIFAIT